MEIYIDDMLSKSDEEIDHITDLKKAFNNFHYHWMKLNQGKYAFRVTINKFLDFQVI